MGELLAAVVPLGLSAAVSPVMLGEQVVLVGGPRGRRLGALYALGAVVVLVAVVVLASVLGRSLRLPTAPHLNAGTDIVLGLVVLVAALVVGSHRPRGRRPHQDRPVRPHGPMSPPVALGFGMVSMATNVTTLAIVLVAVKDVTATGAAVEERAPALALLVVLASIPAWLPVLLTLLPGDASGLLGRVNDLVSRHGREVAVVVMVVVGCFLVGRGLVHLTGL